MDNNDYKKGQDLGNTDYVYPGQEIGGQPNETDFVYPGEADKDKHENFPNDYSDYSRKGENVDEDQANKTDFVYPGEDADAVQQNETDYVYPGEGEIDKHKNYPKDNAGYPED